MRDEFVTNFIIYQIKLNKHIYTQKPLKKQISKIENFQTKIYLQTFLKRKQI